MKRKTLLRNIKYFAIASGAAAVGILTANAVLADVESDAVIAQADEFIEEHKKNTTLVQENTTLVQELVEETTTFEEPDIYSMDVWSLGSYLYGIPEWDTTRTLKLITAEGYEGSVLSYYVACCCWVRATEGYWGYDNLYRAFGEADANYDLWMDEIEIADWAYDYLWWCYMEPSYVQYCNGMVVPESWIYEEDGIYVW